MKLYYCQIFLKFGKAKFNLEGYYTKKQLKDKRIEHYSIIEIVNTK